ncbi:MAG: hypothetical protein M0Q92_12645 [Methanoregula sp.]|nr:hypothetical protein [Methanoregula sp.]
MSGKTKYALTVLCLIVFAGFFASASGFAAKTMMQPQCASSAHGAAGQGNYISSCIDQCMTQCEPGHWFCRGVCIVGCNPIPPYTGM